MANNKRLLQHSVFKPKCHELHGSNMVVSKRYNTYIHCQFPYFVVAHLPSYLTYFFLLNLSKTYNLSLYNPFVVSNIGLCSFSSGHDEVFHDQPNINLSFNSK